MNAHPDDFGIVDASLSRGYRNAVRDEGAQGPPLVLDIAILAAAHRAVASKPQAVPPAVPARQPLRFARWRWPLALAASVLFGVLIAILFVPGETEPETHVLAQAPQLEPQPSPTIPSMPQPSMDAVGVSGSPPPELADTSVYEGLARSPDAMENKQAEPEMSSLQTPMPVPQALPIPMLEPLPSPQISPSDQASMVEAELQALPMPEPLMPPQDSLPPQAIEDVVGGPPMPEPVLSPIYERFENQVPPDAVAKEQAEPEETQPMPQQPALPVPQPEMAAIVEQDVPAVMAKEPASPAAEAEDQKATAPMVESAQDAALKSRDADMESGKAASVQPMKQVVPIKQQNPQEWLEEIEKLRRDGKLKEARESLAEFRKHYPDHELPKALRDLIAK